MINPTQKACWSTCNSCWRCEDKGRFAKCEGCSGRHDPKERLYPDPDDFCDCKNGILRWKTKTGRRIIRKFMSNPFASNVQTDAVSQDERDWNQWVTEKQEKLGIADWDPVRFTDGSSSMRWNKAWKQGQQNAARDWGGG